MSETSQLIFAIIVLLIVYLFSRRFHVWRIKRAYNSIITDLEQQGALDPSTAVELPYAKKHIFRVGMRDYRPQAVDYMVKGQIIGVTDGGRYYLLKRLDSLEQTRM